MLDGDFNEKFYKTEVRGVVFTLLNRYKNPSLIGSGSQGFVVRAYDEVEKREVAIKKLTRPFNSFISARRAYREFCVLNIHNHPNLVKLLNAYTPETTPTSFNELYLITELGHESLLNTMYSSKGKLTHNQVSFLLYQALCGVNHLNQLGIIHRDLKPENIIVYNNCVLKIIDFGLSRQVYAQMTPYTMTRQYRAPEILVGLPYSFNVDIWSLGCIFAELFIANPKQKPTRREVLFPGNDHLDQWTKIIEILGTPDSKFINRTTNFRTYIERLPRHEPQPWTQILPDNCFSSEQGENYHTAQMAREMISKMLKIDPEERYTIDEALNDEYVRIWRRNEEINAQPNGQYDDSIEANTSADSNEWRDLIFNEIKKYESTHNIVGESSMDDEEVTMNDKEVAMQ